MMNDTMNAAINPTANMNAIVPQQNQNTANAKTDDMAAFKAKIEKITMMKEAGMISEEEFNALKAQLISSIL